MNLKLILYISLTIGILQLPSNASFAQTKASNGVAYASSGFADGGRFFTVNPITGAASLVGDITGVNAVSGLAIDKYGNIYGTDVSDPFDAKLIRIDAASGAPTLIGALGIVGPDAIAFGPDGKLYASETGFLDQFYSIDPNTAATTLIGNFGLPGLQVVGMAYDPLTGILYASTAGIDNIYTINTSTGTATLVGSTGLGSNTPDLFFDRYGQLYGTIGGGGGTTGGMGGGSGTSRLISIDKNTGAGTIIASMGFRAISGMDFYSSHLIPTMGEWAMIILGILLVIIGVTAARNQSAVMTKF